MGLKPYAAVASIKREVEEEASLPEFSPVNVTYTEYANEYESNRNYQSKWLGRKIVAIPAALFSAIVKTIYHLVLAIFHGIPKVCTEDSRALKANLYSLVRDLEEALGWITTLFYDKAGCYLVEEAEYQKDYYRNNDPNDDRDALSGIRSHSASESDLEYPPTPTLAEIANDLNQQLPLKARVQNWWNRIYNKYTDQEENLEKTTLALAEAGKQIQALNLQQTQILLPYLPVYHLAFAQDKITQLDLSGLNSSQIRGLLARGGISGYTETEELFATLSIEQVQSILLALAGTGNTDCLQLISATQLPHLNLSELESQHISLLFPTYDPHNNNQIRFCSLSVDQIQGILPKFSDSYLFSLLNNLDQNEFQKLDFSQLNSAQISSFLSLQYIGWTSKHLSRFSQEQADQVRSKSNSFHPRILDLINSYFPAPKPVTTATTGLATPSLSSSSSSSTPLSSHSTSNNSSSSAVPLAPKAVMTAAPAPAAPPPASSSSLSSSSSSSTPLPFHSTPNNSSSSAVPLAPKAVMTAAPAAPPPASSSSLSSSSSSSAAPSFSTPNPPLVSEILKVSTLASTTAPAMPPPPYSPASSSSSEPSPPPYQIYSDTQHQKDIATILKNLNRGPNVVEEVYRNADYINARRKNEKLERTLPSSRLKSSTKINTPNLQPPLSAKQEPVSSVIPSLSSSHSSSSSSASSATFAHLTSKQIQAHEEYLAQPRKVLTSAEIDSHLKLLCQPEQTLLGLIRENTGGPALRTALIELPDAVFEKHPDICKNIRNYFYISHTGNAHLPQLDPDMKKYTEELERHFRQLSPTKVKLALHHLELRRSLLLSDAQIIEMDRQRVFLESCWTEEKLLFFFPRPLTMEVDLYQNYDGARRTKERFQLLSPNTVNTLRQNNCLSIFHFPLMSDAQIQGLSLIEFPQDELLFLFPISKGNKQSDKEVGRRFELLSSEQVSDGFSSIMRSKLRPLISLQQLEHMDFSKLKSTDIGMDIRGLFLTEDANGSLAKTRIQRLVQVGNIQHILPHFKTEAFKLLTDCVTEQEFQTLDFSKLPMCSMIELLPTNENFKAHVSKCFKQFTLYQLQCIQEKLGKDPTWGTLIKDHALDLTKAQLELIFPRTKKTLEKEKEIFASLDPETVIALLGDGRIPEDNEAGWIALLSEDQRDVLFKDKDEDE